MKKAIFINLFCLLFVPLFAQLDAGNYQLLFNKMALNPAFSGSRDVGYISAAYRSAWGRNVEGAPISQLITAHTPLKEKRIAVGTTFMLNNIGVTQHWEISLNYAYRFKLKSGILSMGLRTSTSAYRVKYSELRAETFADASLPQSNSSLYYSNYGLGLMYKADKWYFGVSVPKLVNRNNEELDDEFRELATNDQRSFFIATGGILDFSDKVKFNSGLIMEYGSDWLDVSMNISLIFFNRLWTGFTYSSEGLLEGIMQFQVSPRMRLGLGQTFEMNELHRYHNGGFMLRAEYQFRDKEAAQKMLF